MLDTATCNATDLAACPTTPPPTVAVPSNAVAGAVDSSTRTRVRERVRGPGLRMPGRHQRRFGVRREHLQRNSAIGMRPARHDTARPSFPPDVQVNPANQTLYTANGDDTISAFNLHDCNAGDLSGCATDTPGTVTHRRAPPRSLWVAVDAPLHTVYVGLPVR